MELSVGQRADLWDKSSAELTESETQYMALCEPQIAGSDNSPLREVVTMSDETTSASTDAGNTSSADAGSTQQQSTTTETQAPQKTYTQDELDNVVTERLNKKYKEYETFKQQASQVPTLQSQLQSLTSEKTELETNFNTAVKDAVTLKVAIEKQVPLDLVDRLKGNTADEIAADAEKLMKQVGGSKPAFSGFNGGVSPGGTPHSADGPDAILRQALGYGQ